AIRLVAFAVTVLLSVGSSALLFRHLKVVDSGYYATIMSLVTLCGGLTDAGLSAIGVRELATRDREGRRSLMRDLSGIRLALAALGVGAAVAFAAIVDYGSARVLGTAIAGVGMVLIVLQDTYAINLTARLQIGWLAVADVVRVAVLSLVIVVLVVADAGLLPFYAAGIPAALSVAVLTGRLVRRDVPLMPSFRPRAWRGLLRDTVAYSLATAVIAVYFRVAIILVSLISTGQQTGYFAVSSRVIDVLLSVPPLLVGVTFPIFARAARDDLARLSYAVGRVFDVLVIVGFGVALALSVGAPFIIVVVGGPLFHPAEAVLRIQGLALIASFIGSVWAYTLLSLHRHREILITSLTALLVSIVLVGTLASVDGARGAAIGTVISETTFVLMLTWATYRAGMRPEIAWSALPRVVGAATLGASVLAIPDLADVVRLALALVLYLGGLLLLRAVPMEILEQLPSWSRAA
ncbi:MAG: polysaccharide biosynthesis C-terminal domain-containing protein, partial [Solirubrobacteraceae bacterium]